MGAGRELTEAESLVFQRKSWLSSDLQDFRERLGTESHQNVQNLLEVKKRELEYAENLVVGEHEQGRQITEDYKAERVKEASLFLEVVKAELERREIVK